MGLMLRKFIFGSLLERGEKKEKSPLVTSVQLSVVALAPGFSFYMLLRSFVRSKLNQSFLNKKRVTVINFYCLISPLSLPRMTFLIYSVARCDVYIPFIPLLPPPYLSLFLLLFIFGSSE